MADGDPNAVFRLEWWPYSYTRRLFQNNGIAPVVVVFPFQREYPRYSAEDDAPQPRRGYAPVPSSIPAIYAYSFQRVYPRCDLEEETRYPHRRYAPIPSSIPPAYAYSFHRYYPQHPPDDSFLLHPRHYIHRRYSPAHPRWKPRVMVF